MSVSVIILAAGQGSRMESDLPKVLHRLGSMPLVVHAIRTAQNLTPEEMVVVVGHGGAQVARVVQDADDTAHIVAQDEQLGTAHAVDQARAVLDGVAGDVIVLYGDTPFIREETLQEMQRARRDHDLVVLGFETADPGRYGRLVATGPMLERIVEFKDATDEEKRINLCNSGVICGERARVFDLVVQVGNDNAAGEYYLTDIIGLARKQGLSAGIVICDESETLGINTRAELASAEAAFQARARLQALENGVTLQAPDTAIFSQDTVIGRDAVIEPYVVFGPGVTVESGATIRAFSHLEGCHVSAGAIVGPYARLRPGAELAEDVRIGNFVEVKNAQVDEGAKINHLSYVGDAHIGAGANLGAGTVTCNYDGVFKHHTDIGAQAFIGSSTMLVAPVRVGAGAMTGSGSVITADVPDGALALGRARQQTKPGLARRLMDRLRAQKSAQSEEN